MYKIVFIIFLFTSPIVFGQEFEEDSLSGFWINSKAVSEKTFNEFLDKLEPVKGTWYCDEMEEGGQTGYDAKDKKGNVYSYYCLSHPTEGHCSIDLLKK